MKEAVRALPVLIILSLKAILRATRKVTHQMKVKVMVGKVGDAPSISRGREVVVTEYNRNRIAVPCSAVIAPSIMT